MVRMISLASSSSFISSSSSTTCSYTAVLEQKHTDQAQRIRRKGHSSGGVRRYFQATGTFMD